MFPSPFRLPKQILRHLIDLPSGDLGFVPDGHFVRLPMRADTSLMRKKWVPSSDCFQNYRGEKSDAVTRRRAAAFNKRVAFVEEINRAAGKPRLCQQACGFGAAVGAIFGPSAFDSHSG